MQPFNSNNSTSNGVSKYEAALSLSSLNNSTENSLPKFLSNANNIIKLVPTSLLETTQLDNIDSESSTTTLNLNENNQNVCYMMHTPLDLVTTTITTTSQQPIASPAIAISKQNNLSKILSNHSNSANLTIPLTTTTTTTVSCLSPILSSSSSSPTGSLQTSNKIVRDEKRRANHNEVEKRRRNNINKWIVELSKIIPDCSNDQSKHGQVKFKFSEQFNPLKYFMFKIFKIE